MKNENKISRSQALDLLRFPLAVVVLTLHVLGHKVTGVEALCSNHYLPVYTEFTLFVDGFLRGQSVPVYFFIAGFTFFIGLQAWDNNKYRQKIHNRCRSLLIPYLIFNFGWPLLSWCFSYFGPLFTGGADEPFPDINTILHKLWAYGVGSYNEATSVKPMPYNYPLWFLRDLMLMVAIAPLLYRLIRAYGKLFLPTVAAVWFVYRLKILPFYIPADALLFFSFGAYMSINNMDITENFGKYAKLSCCVYIISAAVYMFVVFVYPHFVNTLIIIRSVRIVAGLFFAYNSATWLLKNDYCRVNKFLATSSFFVYITHIFVISKIFYLSEQIISPANGPETALVYIATVIVSLLIILGVFWFMQKFTPKILSVIAGRK